MIRVSLAGLAFLVCGLVLAACGDGGSTTTVVSTAPAAQACPTGNPVLDEASFVVVTDPAPGSELVPGSTVRGCSRTFESTVPWTLRDRSGDVIDRGVAMGGGVDGAAPFSFTVDYTLDEAQVGILEVEEPDPSDGEGLPPTRAVLAVVLTAAAP